VELILHFAIRFHGVVLINHRDDFIFIFIKVKMTQKFTGDLKRRIWFRSLGDVTSGQTDMIKLVKHDFIFFKRTEYRLRVLRFLTEF